MWKMFCEVLASHKKYVCMCVYGCMCVCLHFFKVLSPYWKVTTCFWIVGEHLWNYPGVLVLDTFILCHSEHSHAKDRYKTICRIKKLWDRTPFLHIYWSVYDCPVFFFAEDQLFELQTAKDLAIILKEGNFLKEDKERNVFWTALKMIGRIDLVKKFQIYIAAGKS